VKITIWGCRGSITTAGINTIRYGGNSACLEVRSEEGNIIIIDAGSGLRNLGKAIRSENKSVEIRFFFTHSHWDHLVGFPFFEPAYLDGYRITICAGPHFQESIKKYLSRQMEPPHFPVEFSNLKAKFNFRCDNKKCDGSCPVGVDLKVSTIPLSHPNGGYGYKFTEYGKTFVYLTDNELGFQHEGGLSPEKYIDFCFYADLLLHDAQYTTDEYERTRGWGHSTYVDAINLAIKAKVKRLGLIHHDPDRTDDDLDRQVDLCKSEIKKMGSDLDCFACSEGMEISL